MNSEVISLPLDRILIGRRLRAIDPDYAALMATSMAETGQHTPVHVGPADAEGVHPLIAGGHRCAAAKLVGLATVNAMVFRGDALAAQLLEIDENLMRRGLSEMDRAVFLSRRKEIYEALHPETGMGKAPKGQERQIVVLSGMPAFSENVAEKLGLSRRSIERAISRARIEPDLRDLLARTCWADHGQTLDGLVRLSPENRRGAVLALTRAEAPAPNLPAAVAEVTGALEGVRSEGDNQFRRLESAWDKAERPVRRRWLRVILNAEPKSRVLMRELLAEFDDGDVEKAREADAARVAAALRAVHGGGGDA